MQVLLVVAQVEYGVEHQLSRAMIGYFAATLRTVQGKGRCVARESQVVQGATRAQGKDRGMLQQHNVIGGEQLPGIVLLLHVMQQVLLQGQRLWLVS